MEDFSLYFQCLFYYLFLLKIYFKLFELQVCLGRIYRYYTEEDNTIVIDDSNNLFVSKYQMYLPTEEELKAEIERDVLELGLREKDDG